MQRVAVMTAPVLDDATRALTGLGGYLQRASTALGEFSASFQLDVPARAFWRRMHPQVARIECLRLQAKRKGRPGWKDIPRRYAMPDPLRFHITFEPVEAS